MKDEDERMRKREKKKKKKKNFVKPRKGKERQFVARATTRNDGWGIQRIVKKRNKNKQ